MPEGIAASTTFSRSTADVRPGRPSCAYSESTQASREKASHRAVASLLVATDTRWLTLEIFQSGPERTPSYRDDLLNGFPVSHPVTLNWRSHRDAPGRIRVRVGLWPSGVYYARLTAHDGRIGYAPLIVRPRRLGEHRIAVVMPTNTWAAYDFWDETGDGIGDTWYAACTVQLDRPFLQRGEPPHFRRYDLPFLHWLAWDSTAANDLPSPPWISEANHPVDYLGDADVEAVINGGVLARAYDLIVFPGHHEYVTSHEYDVVVQYRNRGGNLAFLTANNFFWRVNREGGRLRRVAKWRDLGRPEAALIGVQYRANDEGQRKGAFVIRDTADAAWLFDGTGLVDGSAFTGYGYPGGPFGIEIDATAASSPAGTKVLAEIPDIYGPGITAQMTYYETLFGAKVFAAGAFSLAGAATSQPITRLLDNLWEHLARP